MFEFEATPHAEHCGKVPDALREQYIGRTLPTHLGLTLWEEHCTECGMPACYETCGLYEARRDGHCRRFRNGFQRVTGWPGELRCGAKLTFKRHAELQGFSFPGLLPARRVLRIERTLNAFAVLVAALPEHRLSIAGRAAPACRLFRRMKHHMLKHWTIGNKQATRASTLMLDIFQETSQPIHCTVALRDHAGTALLLDQLTVQPGPNSLHLDLGSACDSLPYDERMAILINPELPVDDEANPVTWYLGFCGLAGGTDSSEQPPSHKTGHPTRKVKLLAWDLDNTLWDGILVEDGLEGIRLKAGIRNVIASLDKRGILQSIVSKNDPGQASAALRHFGLEHYFIEPRFSWNPKSEQLASIRQHINIGFDAMAFIDDTPFERDEVAHALPDLLVLPAEEYLHLPTMEAFQSVTSAESANRRSLYQAESQRKQAREEQSADYLDFLKGCRIELHVEALKQERLRRVYELAQRTNQMNFMQRRYSEEELLSLMEAPHHNVLCMRCTDRFGDYGTIGLCVLDHEKPGEIRIKDLMFSCRIQGKYIEHAFLVSLIDRARERGPVVISALCRKTPRNEKALSVFRELGFVHSEGEAGTEHYTMASNSNPYRDHLVTHVLWDANTSPYPSG